LVLLYRDRTGSAGDAGWLVAAATFPQLVTGPLVAPGLDRRPRPWGAVRFAGVAAGCACAGIAVTAGRQPLALVAACAVAIAFCEPLFNGGLSALAGRSRWSQRAFAWDSLAYNVAGLAGPALVTLLAIVASPAWAMAAIGAGCAAIVATSAGLTVDEPAERSRPAAATLRAAVAAIAARPRLRSATLATTVAFAGIGALPLAVVAATDRLGRPASSAGLVLTTAAIGGLAGSLAMTRARAGWPPERAVQWALAGSGVALVLMCSRSWLLLLAGALLLGLFDAPLLVGLFAVRTDETAAELRATVFTLAASAKLAAASIGAVLAGQLLDGRATPAGLAAIAALQWCGATIGWLTLRSGARARRTPTTTPTTATARHRSG
jgi:hypothetical protein